MIFVYILIGILVFGVLIASHEFGHFITAKACGVRVNEFSVGMGPAIWKKQKGETLYALRWIPIGGYCAMAGEDSSSEDPRAFTNQAPWKRVIILCAGAAMNFLLGLLVIFLIYLSAWGFTVPVISGFMEGCPYESEEGLHAGDQVWSIDGHRIYNTDDLRTFLNRGGETYDIVVIRDGSKVKLEDFYMVKQVYDDPEVKYFGFNLDNAVEKATFGKRIQHTWDTAMQFSRMVWMGLGDLIHGEVEAKDLGGPVAIVDIMAETGKQSESFGEAMQNILLFAAMIAVNLAIVNLLPIPALDGGRIFLLLVTCIIEAITKKKLDPKYEGYIHLVGMVLLLGLMAFVFYNDIVRIVTR